MAFMSKNFIVWMRSTSTDGLRKRRRLHAISAWVFLVCAVVFLLGWIWASIAGQPKSSELAVVAILFGAMILQLVMVLFIDLILSERTVDK